MEGLKHVQRVDSLDPQLGKFSAEVQAVREKEQLYSTITARTMFRQREYEVKLDTMSELSSQECTRQHLMHKGGTYNRQCICQKTFLRITAHITSLQVMLGQY